MTGGGCACRSSGSAIGSLSEKGNGGAAQLPSLRCAPLQNNGIKTNDSLARRGFVVHIGVTRPAGMRVQPGSCQRF
jgi:hypothetical protein